MTTSMEEASAINVSDPGQGVGEENGSLLLQQQGSEEIDMNGERHVVLTSQSHFVDSTTGELMVIIQDENGQQIAIPQSSLMQVTNEDGEPMLVMAPGAGSDASVMLMGENGEGTATVSLDSLVSSAPLADSIAQMPNSSSANNQNSAQTPSSTSLASTQLVQSLDTPRMTTHEESVPVPSAIAISQASANQKSEITKEQGESAPKSIQSPKTGRKPSEGAKILNSRPMEDAGAITQVSQAGSQDILKGAQLSASHNKAPALNSQDHLASNNSDHQKEDANDTIAASILGSDGTGENFIVINTEDGNGINLSDPNQTLFIQTPEGLIPVSAAGLTAGTEGNGNGGTQILSSSQTGALTAGGADLAEGNIIQGEDGISYAVISTSNGIELAPVSIAGDANSNVLSMGAINASQKNSPAGGKITATKTSKTTSKVSAAASKGAISKKATSQPISSKQGHTILMAPPTTIITAPVSQPIVTATKSSVKGLSTVTTQSGSKSSQPLSGSKKTPAKPSVHSHLQASSTTMVTPLDKNTLRVPKKAPPLQSTTTSLIAEPISSPSHLLAASRRTYSKRPANTPVTSLPSVTVTSSAKPSPTPITTTVKLVEKSSTTSPSPMNTGSKPLQQERVSSKSSPITASDSKADKIIRPITKPVTTGASHNAGSSGASIASKPASIQATHPSAKTSGSKSPSVLSSAHTIVQTSVIPAKPIATSSKKTNVPQHSPLKKIESAEKSASNEEKGNELSDPQKSVKSQSTVIAPQSSGTTSNSSPARVGRRRTSSRSSNLEAETSSDILKDKPELVKEAETGRSKRQLTSSQQSKESEPLSEASIVPDMHSSISIADQVQISSPLDTIQEDNVAKSRSQEKDLLSRGNLPEEGMVNVSVIDSEEQKNDSEKTPVVENEQIQDPSKTSGRKRRVHFNLNSQASSIQEGEPKPKRKATQSVGNVVKEPSASKTENIVNGPKEIDTAPSSEVSHPVGKNPPHDAATEGTLASPQVTTNATPRMSSRSRRKQEIKLNETLPDYDVAVQPFAAENSNKPAASSKEKPSQDKITTRGTKRSLASAIDSGENSEKSQSSKRPEPEDEHKSTRENEVDGETSKAPIQENNLEPELNTTPKRRPGRPRRSSNVSQESETPSKESTSEPLRDETDQHAVEPQTLTDSAVESEATPAKRRPGRPKKSVTINETQQEEKEITNEGKSTERVPRASKQIPINEQTPPTGQARRGILKRRPFTVAVSNPATRRMERGSKDLIHMVLGSPRGELPEVDFTSERRKTIGTLSEARDSRDFYEYKRNETHFYIRHQINTKLSPRGPSSNLDCAKCEFKTTRLANVVQHHKVDCPFLKNAVLHWLDEIKKQQVKKSPSHASGQRQSTSSKSSGVASRKLRKSSTPKSSTKVKTIPAKAPKASVVEPPTTEVEPSSDEIEPSLNEVEPPSTEVEPLSNESDAEVQDEIRLENNNESDDFEGLLPLDDDDDDDDKMVSSPIEPPTVNPTPDFDAIFNL